MDRYVSILKSDEFQAALEEATVYKRKDIEEFRQMLGRTSAVRSLNKFT